MANLTPRTTAAIQDARFSTERANQTLHRDVPDVEAELKAQLETSRYINVGDRRRMLRKIATFEEYKEESEEVIIELIGIIERLRANLINNNSKVVDLRNAIQDLAR